MWSPLPRPLWNRKPGQDGVASSPAAGLGLSPRGRQPFPVLTLNFRLCSVTCADGTTESASLSYELLLT